MNLVTRYIKTENKSKIQKILDKMWYSKRNEYSQGKGQILNNTST